MTKRIPDVVRKTVRVSQLSNCAQPSVEVDKWTEALVLFAIGPFTAQERFI